MAVSSRAPDRQSRRLTHFTPLRYPGGKARLALFVKRLVQANDLLDGEYVETYAGGAAVAVELLLHEYVSRIHINDISRPIHAFWKSVLGDTDELCRLVQDTRLTMRVRDRQKDILTNQDDHDDLALGFAMFFLNRTNRSGILNAGVIGGRDQ
jgi:DNA adenine methylase